MKINQINFKFHCLFSSLEIKLFCKILYELRNALTLLVLLIINFTVKKCMYDSISDIEFM